MCDSAISLIRAFTSAVLLLNIEDSLGDNGVLLIILSAISCNLSIDTFPVSTKFWYSIVGTISSTSSSPSTSTTSPSPLSKVPSISSRVGTSSGLSVNASLSLIIDLLAATLSDFSSFFLVTSLLAIPDFIDSLVFSTFFSVFLIFSGDCSLAISSDKLSNWCWNTSCLALDSYTDGLIRFTSTVVNLFDCISCKLVCSLAMVFFISSLSSFLADCSCWVNPSIATWCDIISMVFCTAGLLP